MSTLAYYSLILNLCNHRLANMSSRYDGHISMIHYSHSDPLLILNVPHCVSVMGIHIGIDHLHYMTHYKAQALGASETKIIVVFSDASSPCVTKPNKTFRRGFTLHYLTLSVRSRSQLVEKFP